MNDRSFRAAQTSIVKEMFLHTADENYIVARWSTVHGLQTDFLWNALHALEKYMKAVLLLNGVSGDASHDIVDLFEQAKKIAGPLLPSDLPKPANLDIHHWRKTTADEFIARLNDYGSASNRYLVLGWATTDQDVHLLDALVFAIRRLAWRLDDPYLPQCGASISSPTFRDILTKQPRFCQPQGETLEKLINGKDSELRHAALNLNMPFAPENYPHTPVKSGSVARHPVLGRRILDALASDDVDWVKEGIDLADWVLANIRVPKPIKLEIIAARNSAKKKHGLP